MVRITIDPITRAKLNNLDSYLEPCDESVRGIGRFIPAHDPKLHERVESPVCDEELDRRSREESGRPLADILLDLEGRQ